MIDKLKKSVSKIKRAERSRFKLKKSGSRLRLVFNKSNKYLSCQIIDDLQGVTLAYATTSEKNVCRRKQKEQGRRKDTRKVDR